MEIQANHIIKELDYLHGVITDEDQILELIRNIHGDEEVSRILNKANIGNPFHKFKDFYNFTGILTYHNMVFQLNLFEFDSLDIVLDHFSKFAGLDWSTEDKENFTALVHNSFDSKMTIQLIE